jgi:hypothetical protein
MSAIIGLFLSASVLGYFIFFDVITRFITIPRLRKQAERDESVMISYGNNFGMSGELALSALDRAESDFKGRSYSPYIHIGFAEGVLKAARLAKS